MWRALRDMADHPWMQPNAPAIDPQPAPTFEDLTDDVAIAVADLLGVGTFFRTEGDETGVESFGFEAFLVANLVVEFGQPLHSCLEIDDFHLGFFRLSCENLADTVWCAGRFGSPRRARSTRRAWIFLILHTPFFALKLFFFVIFVSSVVNTSPQKTQNSLFF
jgi:hypothetical protein